ncbi:MAG: hypothetical protein P4L83_03410 [Nevskia sp.]|nr:hypothetical protein [Nevskia sp.]
MTLLALKLLLVPLLVCAISLAGHRWGPGVAGWLSGFPVISAPVLLFLAIDQGTGFAAAAAVGTLSAVTAILCFGIAYAWAACRYTWLPSLGLSLGIYAVAVAAIDTLAPPLWAAAAMTLGAMLAAPRLFPHPPPPQSWTSPPALNLPFRMLAGAVLVLLVTGFAQRLGARLSGMLAMFPVLGSVLAVFSHRQLGAGFVVPLLRGMVYGYYAFAAFCLALALALPALGIATSFLLALACAMLIQAGSRLLLGSL